MIARYISPEVVLLVYILTSVLLTLGATVWTVRKRKIDSSRKLPVWLPVALLSGAIAVLSYFSFVAEGVPLLVDSRSGDGFEFMLSQNFNGLTEYEVNFYYKPRGEPWFGILIDHDAFRWTGEIDVDAYNELVSIRNRSKEVAKFNWKTERLENLVFNSTVVGPQWKLESGHPLDLHVDKHRIWIRNDQ